MERIENYQAEGDYSKFVYDERFMKQIDRGDGFCWD